VPENNEAPPPLPWLAVKKSLLDRWRERPRLSEASPKWIAKTALPAAFVAALAAGTLCYVAVWVLCRSKHSGDNFTLVMLGLLGALLAAIPIFFLARSWRHYFIAAGCLFAGWLAGILPLLYLFDIDALGPAGTSATVGVGIGAGLGLGLGIARRTLSGIIGGLLLGQLAGLAGAAAGMTLVAVFEDTGVIELGVSPEVFAFAFGAPMAAGFAVAYLILLPGLAGVEHAVDKLSARAKRKAAGDDEGEPRAGE